MANAPSWRGPVSRIKVDKQVHMSTPSSVAELARDVLENMSEAFSLLDREFVVLDLNSAALALDGRAYGEVVGRSAWELSPGLESTEIGAALQRVMRTREAEGLAFLHTWPDERSAWLDVRVLPVEAGVALFYRDVTAEIEQAQQLGATTQRLDAILSNTTMAVFLMDYRQQCVYANSAAEKLTGYSYDHMRGRPLHDVIHHKRPDGSHYPLEECPIDRAFPERMQMQGDEL
ncbi:MAG: PAS domain-containing protein, partial [Pseudomonadota bacterium]|nr:PAS domain-containing protein [Pseudomonadota bacterium]